MTAAALVELLVPPERPTEEQVKQAMWQLVSEGRLDLGEGLNVVLVQGQEP
jgi:hypothetical protein